MLDNLAEWSSLWQMSFNTDKCHVLHAGKKNQEFLYDWGSGQLAQTLQEKDVGVLTTKNLFTVQRQQIKQTRYFA